MGISSKLFASNAPCSTVLIRLLVGGTLLSEGIREFFFADDPGIGQFVKLGIPGHKLMAPLIGVCEIGCGAPLLIGLLTRIAAIAVIVNISVASLSTKIPPSSGHDFWMNLPNVVSCEFWRIILRSPHRLRHAPGRDIPLDRRRQVVSPSMHCWPDGVAHRKQDEPVPAEGLGRAGPLDMTRLGL